jgi:E3 ubiquitin-protein ligase BRE1
MTQLIKEEMEDLKKSLIRIQKEKAELECKIGHADTQTNQAYADLAAMRQHCDELITRNSFNENEIIKLKETTAIARKEAADAASRVQDMSNLVASFRKNPSDTGAYSSDVLLTQVNHLKGRLSCPVCNARDKQVILLRCRHMFCRQCVDTSIKNRSRKCPACGQRFDTKDVGDVWL